MNHEGSQIEVPDSFLSLYRDRRQRLTLGWGELLQRYELCEDLALQLSEHCRQLHVEIGVDEQDALERIHRGLGGPDAVLSPQEARWVTTRLAELMGWPLPEAPAPTGIDP